MQSRESNDYTDPNKHPERYYIGKEKPKVNVYKQPEPDRYDYHRRKAAEARGWFPWDDRLADEPDFDTKLDIDRE